jgi:hypothetical protein
MRTAALTYLAFSRFVRSEHLKVLFPENQFHYCRGSVTELDSVTDLD